MTLRFLRLKALTIRCATRSGRISSGYLSFFSKSVLTKPGRMSVKLIQRVYISVLKSFGSRIGGGSP